MQILSNAEFARLKKEATPSAQQIKAYYDAHLEDYDMVKIRRVFIFAAANPQNGQGLTREQAKAMADAVKGAIAANKDVIATINAISAWPHRCSRRSRSACLPARSAASPKWTRPPLP